MTHQTSQDFLRELKKNLWMAAVRLRSNLTAGEDLPACYRDRRGETLFIDARKLGFMKDRVLRDFSEEDIEKIAGTFHQWRLDEERMLQEAAKRGIILEFALAYHDSPGFCKSLTLEEITTHGHVLTPGRYVGAEDIEDDGEGFDEKMTRLAADLKGQFAESTKLETAIRANLKGLGYGF